MRWLFTLCRALGVLHPDYLLERLSASQLVDWWWVYHDEPWGEVRADWRQAAGLALKAGAEDWDLIWPYLLPPETEAEVRADFAEIEADLIRQGVLDGDRSKD